LKLLVGLGNPGQEYAETRHNVGFKVTGQLAARHSVKFRSSARWQARTARLTGGGHDVLLAEPTTFMNLSGWAVREIVAYYKIALADILVMVDDADLPLGKLRIRMSGSAGGHNGLKSIIQELGSQEFPRLRIGVGRQAGELRHHVLGRFASEERALIETAVRKAADAAEMFVTEDIRTVMNKFNLAETQSTEDQA
jgi:PTH1 family peptidyl-tRNA hydrolase